jgi:hypothetical protein
MGATGLIWAAMKRRGVLARIDPETMLSTGCIADLVGKAASADRPDPTLVEDSGCHQH